MLFWIGFGIATSLMFSSPAAAQSRQVGIDIPVQWVADIDGSMTLETFLALPESALTTGQRIPSFGYSAKRTGLRATCRRPILTVNLAGCSSAPPLSITSAFSTVLPAAISRGRIKSLATMPRPAIATWTTAKAY